MSAPQLNSTEAQMNFVPSAQQCKSTQAQKTRWLFAWFGYMHAQEI